MHPSRIILSCALEHVNARNAYYRFDHVISNQNSQEAILYIQRKFTC